MAVNNRLDRRHDINKGERLPERLSRVLDEEQYRIGMDMVKANEGSESFRKALEEKRVSDAKILQAKKDRTIPGAVVVLKWNGVAFHRADAVSETGLKIGPFWYGWECIEIPSQELLDLVQSEMGTI
jgi:hypothetical protein